MLAEELFVLDGDSALWQVARPLLDVALRLAHGDEKLVWHGWSRSQIEAFLRGLPAFCSLVLAAWETIPARKDEAERERLVLGLVCEVRECEICSLRTFEALPGIKPVTELEPGIEDAMEVLRVVKDEVAPPAWALFIEKSAWDEWLLGEGEEPGRVDRAVDKGAILARLIERGRGVLLGSRAHRHSQPQRSQHDRAAGE